MHTILNAEVARVRYAELLRDAANERLARSLREDDEQVVRPSRLRGYLASFRLHLPRLHPAQ
jgi:hypothetical protein